MRSAVVLSALLGLALAAPQMIDVGAVEAVPDPPKPDLTNPVPPQPTFDAETAALEAAKEVLSIGKRSERLAKRVDYNAPCALQPDGNGPRAHDPMDDEATFYGFPSFTQDAESAPVPEGYTHAFKNKRASSQQNGYMTFTQSFTTYDTSLCAAKCNSIEGCESFNIYFERDPSVNPAEGCANPTSITNIKCIFYGLPVTEKAATNAGQWRGPPDVNGKAFHVVIAGSNGYAKVFNPPPLEGSWNQPQLLPAAINAPLNEAGQDTYMGMKFYPGASSPQQCAAACEAKTAYNMAHPRPDGSYRSCVFFNMYLLSKNGVPEGRYCSFYSQSWGLQYAVNKGQWRGADRYDVSHSVSYQMFQQK